MDPATSDSGPDFRAHIEHGIAARARKAWPEAIEHFRAARVLKPGDRGAQGELAFTLLSSGALDEAAELCRSILLSDPRNTAALVMLGNIGRRKGDHAAAVDYFKQAASGDPANLSLKLEMANSLRLLKRFDEAAEALFANLAADPLHGPSLIALGLIERVRKKHSAAAFFLRLAAKYDVANVDLQCEVAQTMVDLGRPVEAEAAYRQALAIDRAHQDALLGLGLLLRRRDDPTAVFFLQEAVRGDPAHIGLRCELAYTLSGLGRLDEAEAAYREALALDPDHADAWFETGLIRRARGERAAALDAFLRVSDRDLRRGLIQAAAEYRAMGRPDEAREALRRVLAAAPDDYEAMLGLAELAILGADFVAGLELCDALLKAHPTRVRPIVLKCQALALAGRSQEVAELIRSLNEVVPPSDEWDAARLGVLRSCGERREVEALLAATESRVGRSFALWSERVAALTALGQYAPAQEAIAAVSPRNAFERSRVSYLKGVNEDRQWRLAEAVAAFERALDQHGDDPEAHRSLARLYFLMMDPERSALHLRRYLDQDAAGRLMRGESLKLSQNLLGQLLNELNLDRELLARLKTAGDIAGPQRIERLLEIVRSAGDLTPPAIFLLLALRQAGALDREPPAGEAGPSPIPAKIAQHLGGQASSVAARLEESWRTNHPNHLFASFDARAAQAYLQANCPPEALDAYRRSLDWEQAGHVFGLAYLLNEGGIFVGADCRCVGPLPGVAEPACEFIASQEAFANLGTNFLACKPQDPVIARALRSAVTAILRGDKDVPWLSTGPGLITRAFAQVLADQGEAWPLFLSRRQLLAPAEMEKVLALEAPSRAGGRRFVQGEGGLTPEAQGAALGV